MASWTLFCVISPNLVVSGAQCIKVVEDVVVKKFTFAISSPDEFLVGTATDTTTELRVRETDGRMQCCLARSCLVHTQSTVLRITDGLAV